MSIVDTRPVPTNLMAWPTIKKMITQQKFIYSYLYFNPDATACGCYLFSTGRAAGDLSMTQDSLEDALVEFKRRKLIEVDDKTGEIWIMDWPDWHRFNTPAARGALWASINKIRSQILRENVKKAYESIQIPSKEKKKDKEKVSSSKEEEEEQGGNPPPLSPPLAGATATTRKNASTARGPSRSLGRVKCWTNEDKQEAEQLELRHGVEQVQVAVEKLEEEGVEPFPSRVAQALLPRKDHPCVLAAWWTSEESTIKAAREIGLTARPGESMEQFRQKIRAASTGGQQTGL